MKQFRSITFDDVSTDDNGHDWTQVCERCVQMYQFPVGLLDSAGNGICGVQGCSNESDYYLDFPGSEAK